MITSTIVKKGDKGYSVKILQEALGLAADGAFGPQTEAAVKDFQKENNLTADGIVGAATQKALGIEDIILPKCDIVLSPITRHISKRPGDIRYIVIHYTAGSSSAKGSAMRVRNNYQNSNASASADFCVDDEMIVQITPSVEKNYCWSVGDGKGKYSITNANSVSIEVCSTLKKGTTSIVPNHEGWSFSDAVLDNAEKLVKYLMAKYNIPYKRVVRHYDASRKPCPGIIGWNDGPTYDEKGNALGLPNNSEEWKKFHLRFK